MNNNRGNNRRRGRGNNNRQQGGGGHQINRIDSRARGNAPQLLEKYRKLAHDAHLNGDRVTEEYNLQFADHYFRVLADQRQRQDEQRARRDERWDGAESGESEENEEIDSGDSDYAPYDQALRRDTRQRPDVDTSAESKAREGTGSAERSAYEPVENPFVRDNRAARDGMKPRREDRRPRRDENREDNNAPVGLDPSALPPAIAQVREEAPVDSKADEAEAKPRRRTRRPKAAADDTGDALEAVN